MITGPQVRLARQLLNWGPDRLAKRARVATGLIVQTEQQRGATLMAPAVARALRQIFEDEGLEFIDDPLAPVRWRAGFGTPSTLQARGDSTVS